MKHWLQAVPMKLTLRDVWPWAQLQDCLLPPVPVRFHEMVWRDKRMVWLDSIFGYADWRHHAKDFIRLRWIGRGFKLDACWLWEQILLSNKYIYERNMAQKLRREIEASDSDWQDSSHAG